jgi:hypothetical protein
MKVRIFVRGFTDSTPSQLVKLHSAPVPGDLLDSPHYGPCDVVEVVPTPADRSQDALLLLQLRTLPEGPNS